MRKPRPRTRLGRGARDLYNRPLLLIRGGHARYIPATGMCPWQTKRFCAKVVCNSVFGKFGVRDDVDTEREVYCDTDRLADSIARSLGGPIVEPRVPYMGYRREWFAKDKPAAVYYDISSSYPESMTRDFARLSEIPFEPLSLDTPIERELPPVVYSQRDAEILHRSLAMHTAREAEICQVPTLPSVFNSNPEDDHG